MDAAAFDQADQAAMCIHLQVTGAAGFKHGQQVRSAGRPGRVVAFRCDGHGRAAAWVDFVLSTGDVMSLLVPLSELEKA